MQSHFHTSNHGFVALRLKQLNANERSVSTGWFYSFDSPGPNVMRGLKYVQYLDFLIDMVRRNRLWK